jgi:hypothetical protein
MNPKFRGIWIPAEVWFMFLKKEIGATELHLLATIDSLVTPEKGCFASNKYLGKMLGVRPDYIARLISKLKQKQLIQQVKFDGRRRYLETVWSRIEDLDRTSNPDLDLRPPVSSPLGKKDRKGDSGGGFGFVVEAEDEVRQEPFDKACAIQFQSTLPPKKQRKQLPKTWADHFRLLRTEDEHSKETIEEVLDWYCVNSQDQWTPKCYTPKIFRQKFDRVIAAMKRDHQDKPTVDISKEAEKITERLKAKQWPKGSESQLPSFVQLSLDGYQWFQQQVIQKVDQLHPEAETDRQERMRLTRHKNLLNHLVNTLPAPSHFVEMWFDNIWKRVNTWDSWNGNLSSLSFDVGSTQFERYIAGLVVSYGRDANEVSSILTGMK